MKGNILKYIGAIGAMVVGVFIGFVTPLMLAGTIDALVNAANHQMDAALDLPNPVGAWFMARGGILYLMNHLWIIAAILIALYAIGSFFQYLRGRWTAQASERFTKTLRDRLYSHLQRLSYDYHVKAQTGDLIQRCTSDVDTIRAFLSSQLVEIFRSVAMVTIATVVLLNINVRMTLFSMILVPPLFLFAFSFFKLVRKYFQLSDEAEGKLSAVLQENLTGVRVVRAFGRAKFEDEKYDVSNEDYYRKSMKLVRLLSIYWGGSDSLSMLQTGITVVYGVFLVVTSPGQLSIGEMVVFVSYISMLLWPIRQLGRILSDLGKAMVSFGRISEILNTEPEKDVPDAGDYPIDRDIEFNHVGFAYDENHEILKDINLTVRQGQTVALLGATGSGKSTLMHLLQRLYDVSRGEILIGGVNINQIRKEYLRSRVGLVLQEPFLYSRSVRNNIGIARKNVTDDMVYAAAQVANAHEFIEGFEKGYETMVGERGVTLSGGQKQRVAIARTLLKQNDILIFDDSLSAVDTETDRAIREALLQEHAEGTRHATTFIISHRLTTLAEADVIAVIQHGEIVQLGSHEQLIAQEGLYKRIYQIQSALEDEMKDENTAKEVVAHAVL
ncbi:MAG: ABC transporter ATP-binding protein/permease [Eubacteriales bacterium]|nr:ABC transporter ATP-binding protein/permease [Eubacteriales bacterium]